MKTLHQSEQDFHNSVFTFLLYSPQRHLDCHPPPRLLLSHHQNFHPVFLRRKIIGKKNNLHVSVSVTFDYYYLHSLKSN